VSSPTGSEATTIAAASPSMRPSRGPSDSVREDDAEHRQRIRADRRGPSSVVLAHPSNAKTVRVRDGAPAVTDGPFAESKEVLADYYVLDCETIERAIEIVASGDPAARHFAVEVRPIMHMEDHDL
jgi:hypothetical protein